MSVLVRSTSFLQWRSRKRHKNGKIKKCWFQDDCFAFLYSQAWLNQQIIRGKKFVQPTSAPIFHLIPLYLSPLKCNDPMDVDSLVWFMTPSPWPGIGIVFYGPAVNRSPSKSCCSKRNILELGEKECFLESLRVFQHHSRLTIDHLNDAVALRLF